MTSGTCQTYIIAEAGVNHNGSIDMAMRLIDAAAEARADAIKFQTFVADQLVTDQAQKASYQKAATCGNESQLEMLRKLELSYGDFEALKAHCGSRGIEFLSTAFDSTSLRFLSDRLALSAYKVPSGEVTNAPLLLEYAQTGADIILSTGMCDLGEVEHALKIVAFGLLNPAAQNPTDSELNMAYCSEAGRECLARRVTLLHCTTEYPAPLSEINLNAMETLRAAFNLRVGYSDHSEGVVVPIAAVAMGACLIEKHFTLDRTLPGPDHKASLEPVELAEMVRGIRAVEAAKGSSRKGPTVSEVDNRLVARKSLVAIRDIAAGEVFTEANLGVKRPGSGISPTLFWETLGQRAAKAYRKDELL